MKYRVVIVGSGYRSGIFIKLVSALSNDFELLGVLCRSKEKASLIKSTYNVEGLLNKDEIFALKPDFIINAVSKENIYSETIYWLNHHIPVLQETGGLFTTRQLQSLALRVQKGQPLLIAEQYHRYPLVNAHKKLIDSGLIGDIQYVKVQYSHDYHSFNVIKYLLGEDDPISITGSTHNFLVTKTDSREGLCFTGELIKSTVTDFTLDFGTQVGYHLFDNISYRSTILNRHLECVATRGTICNYDVKYLDKDNKPVTSKIIASGNSLSFEGKTLTHNPLLSILPPEEATLSSLLYDMVYLIDGKDLKELVTNSPKDEVLEDFVESVECRDYKALTISHLKDAHLANLANKLNSSHPSVKVRDIFSKINK